jgi:adenylyltransferase/sulfurtransferase
MNDQQLLRYSRHILLPEMGIEAQQRLCEAHALIIGAGGLGSPVALYLASAGVGHITLCDDDQVDLTNLQRQIMHRTDSVGMSKVDSAKRSLHDLNPEIIVSLVQERVSGARLLELVEQADVVIDGCDNFATRHDVNSACVQSHKPLISGAAIRFDGQISVFDLRDPESPCYACLFPEEGESDEVRCAVMGVFAPLTGIIGSLQATEALKLLGHVGQSLAGRLMLFDALNMKTRTLKLTKDPQCRVCSVSAVKG